MYPQPDPKNHPRRHIVITEHTGDSYVYSYNPTYTCRDGPYDNPIYRNARRHVINHGHIRERRSCIIDSSAPADHPDFRSRRLDAENADVTTVRVEETENTSVSYIDKAPWPLARFSKDSLKRPFSSAYLTPLHVALTVSLT